MLKSLTGITHKKLTTVETVSASEAGPIRSLNEDSIAVVDIVGHPSLQKGTLLILADGMGGMDAGEHASKMATEEFPLIFMESASPDAAVALAHSVVELNRRVYEEGENFHKKGGMGTTLVASMILNSSVVTVNVGDSRAYLFRHGRITQLSKDHSMRKEFFSPFRAASRNDFSHVLTQAIGTQRGVTPHVKVTDIHDGDLILLCSDGLTSVVPDKEVERILKSTPFRLVAEQLLAAALGNNADDNISIIVSRIAQHPSEIEDSIVFKEH